MARVDPDNDDLERFVVQQRSESPDECGQHWLDVVAFDDPREMQDFVARRARDRPESAWRAMIWPVGYNQLQHDRRELKRAAAHGVQPSPEAMSQIAGAFTESRPI